MNGHTTGTHSSCSPRDRPVRRNTYYLPLYRHHFSTLSQTTCMVLVHILIINVLPIGRSTLGSFLEVLLFHRHGAGVLLWFKLSMTKSIYFECNYKTWQISYEMLPVQTWFLKSFLGIDTRYLVFEPSESMKSLWNRSLHYGLSFCQGSMLCNVWINIEWNLKWHLTQRMLPNNPDNFFTQQIMIFSTWLDGLLHSWCNNLRMWRFDELLKGSNKVVSFLVLIPGIERMDKD